MPLSFKHRLGLKKLARTDADPAPVQIFADSQQGCDDSSYLSSDASEMMPHTLDIATHLYVGSAGCVQDAPRLASRGITHTLCVAQGLDEDPAVAALEQCGITWKYLGITDKCDEDLHAVLDEAFALIDDVRAAGGRVLVYCFQGKSRSVAVCCAYAMKRSGLSFEAALGRIRLTRPLAEPNIGFSLALLKYGRSLSSGTTAAGDER